MVQYYNISLYGDAENIMEIWAVTDTIMKGMFSLFMILVLGVWIVYMRQRKGDQIEDSLIFASFITFLFALTLYIGQVLYSGILKLGLYVFVPVIILIAMSIVKYYNKR